MQQSGEQSDVSVEKSNAALNRLNTITRSVKHITEMNMQIASASGQQCLVAEDVSKNVNSISSSCSEMGQETEQLTTSGQQLESLANNLNAQITRFKI
jgi:methyl-accepting chemotaxis protein